MQYEHLKPYLDEIIKKLNSELQECHEIEKNYLIPLDSKSPTFRKDLKDKMSGGKYSTEALMEASDRKLRIESTLSELSLFYYYNYKDKQP